MEMEITPVNTRCFDYSNYSVKQVRSNLVPFQLPTELLSSAAWHRILTLVIPNFPIRFKSAEVLGKAFTSSAYSRLSFFAVQDFFNSETHMKQDA